MTEAVDKLVADHRRFLSFLEHRLGHRELAEELLQEAFVRGIEKAGDLRDDESAVAWFYRLLRNAIVDRFRDRDVERRALERFAQELEDAHVEAPEVHAQVCSCLHAVVDDLKPEYAEALRAVDLGDDEVRTFAAKQGITPNNAAVRLHRAREALAKRLTRVCGTCAEHGCLDCHCKRR